MFLFDFVILLVNQNIERPKYTIFLSLETIVHWQVSNGVISAFGLEFLNKFKWFTLPDSGAYLKSQLACKVMFTSFNDFYSLIKPIGKGASCEVFQVQLKSNSNQQFASKIINKSYLQKESDFEEDGLITQISFYNEIKIMEQLNHQSIINLHEVFIAEKQFYLILDLMEGGSLNDFLQDKFHAFTLEEIQLIMKQILNTVIYIHSRQIMHRDLKPENIMFERKGDLASMKIVDFGLAQSKTSKKYSFPKCGTPGYVAPEIANLTDCLLRYSEVCDMFSCGAILYKLFTKKDLFPGKNNQEVLRMNKLCHINLAMLKIYKASANAIDLLEQMLQKTPELRISAKEALDHPFFLEKEELIQVQAQEKKSNFQKQKTQIISKGKWSTQPLQIPDYTVDLNENSGFSPIPSIEAKRGFVMKQGYKLKSLTSSPEETTKPSFKKASSSDWNNNYDKLKQCPPSFKPGFILVVEKVNQIESQAISEDSEEYKIE